MDIVTIHFTQSKYFVASRKFELPELKPNDYVVNRIKPDNEQIYYIIDVINFSVDGIRN